MQLENVYLQAEAYDVAVDISFPKGEGWLERKYLNRNVSVRQMYTDCVCPTGTDGGLEYGTLKVFDDLKLIMQLRNRGKYEIGYQ